RLSPRDDGATTVVVADATGAPVLAVDSLLTRPLDLAALRSRSSGAADSLFAIEWAELELPAEAVGEVEVFACVPDPTIDPASAAREICAAALERLQGAAAAGTRVAFLTHGAVAVGEKGPADPAAAAVWGLVRSAQAEHPDRFLLLDSDGSEES